MMVRDDINRALRRAFLGLNIVIVLLFLIGPLLVVVVASFGGGPHSKIAFPPEQLSLDWYFRIRPRYFETLWTSLWLATVTAAISSVLGVMAALGLVRGRVPGKSLVGSLFRAPLQIPLVVTGFAFFQLYHQIAAALDLNVAGSALGLVVAHVFITLPFVIGTAASSLQRFPVSLEEAALSLGASKLSTFRQVTLPLITPGICAGALYAFIISFGDVPVSMFLAGSRYTTFPVEVFYGLEFDFDPTILAISTLVMGGAFALVLFFQWLIGLPAILGSRS